jgi:hypothetical protein
LFYVHHFYFLLLFADFRTPKPDPDIGYSTGKYMDGNKEKSLLTDVDLKEAPCTINGVQIGLNNMSAVKNTLPGIEIVIS